MPVWQCERGYSPCQATDGANQQANKTSWTDGAQSDLLTARFCIYSLISPVSRTKGSCRSGVWSRDFNGTCSVKTSQPVGNYQTEGFMVSDLLERGRDEGKCGAAFPPLLFSSLPSSVRVFVFWTEINCSLFINLLMVGNCFSHPLGFLK